MKPINEIMTVVIHFLDVDQCLESSSPTSLISSISSEVNGRSGNVGGGGSGVEERTASWAKRECEVVSPRESVGFGDCIDVDIVAICR